MRDLSWNADRNHVMGIGSFLSQSEVSPWSQLLNIFNMGTRGLVKLLRRVKVMQALANANHAANDAGQHVGNPQESSEEIHQEDATEVEEAEYDFVDDHFACIYKHYDSYPTGLGACLAAFLKSKIGMLSAEYGAGDLFCDLIYHLKETARAQAEILNASHRKRYNIPGLNDVSPVFFRMLCL